MPVTHDRFSTVASIHTRQSKTSLSDVSSRASQVPKSGRRRGPSADGFHASKAFDVGMLKGTLSDSGYGGDSRITI